MAITHPNIKASLMADGRWGDFVSKREDYRVLGMGPTAALERVYSDFFSVEELSEMIPPKPVRIKKAKKVPKRPTLDPSAVVPGMEDIPPHPWDTSKRSAPISKPKPPKKVVEAVSKPKSTEKAPSAPKTHKQIREQNQHPKIASVVKASLADFDGRECSMETCVEWVGKHLHICDVDVGMCPDPTAWSLYQQCLSSPVFAQDFWKNLYPKYKKPDGDRGDETVDGSVTIAHLKELKAMRDRAIEAGNVR